MAASLHIEIASSLAGLGYKESIVIFPREESGWLETGDIAPSPAAVMTVHLEGCRIFVVLLKEEEFNCQKLFANCFCRTRNGGVNTAQVCETSGLVLWVQVLS